MNLNEIAAIASQVKTIVDKKKEADKQAELQKRMAERGQYTAEVRETFRAQLPKGVKAGFLCDPKTDMFPVSGLANIARALNAMSNIGSSNDYGYGTSVSTPEAPFEITKEGLSFNTMDTTHIALFEGTIPAQTLASFYYEGAESIKFAVRAPDLVNILTKVADDGDSVSALLEDDALNLTFTAPNGVKRNFHLTLIDNYSPNSNPVPKVELQAKLTFQRAELQKFLSECIKAQEETVTIKANKNSVTFEGAGAGTWNTSSVTFAKDGIVLDILVDEPQQATYSIKNLLSMIKAIHTETLTFEFSTKKPCKLTFPLNEQVDVHYWLAPRATDPDKPMTKQQAYPATVGLPAHAAKEPDESPPSSVPSKSANPTTTTPAATKPNKTKAQK